MNDKEVPWTISDVLVALVIFVVVVTGGSFVLVRLLSNILPKGGSVISLFIGYFILFLLIGYFVIVRRRSSWSTLGFRPFDFSRSLGLVLAWFIIVKIITAAYASIAQRFGLEQTQDALRRIPEIFGKNALGILLAIIIVAVIAPLVEEAFFRGFIYPVFRRRWGVAVGIVASGLLFALFHFNLFLFFPIAVFGFVLAYLFEITNSLWPSVMLHMLNNFLSVVLIYYIGVSA